MTITNRGDSLMAQHQQINSCVARVVASTSQIHITTLSKLAWGQAQITTQN
jgi:hypothetical protein